MRLNERNSVSHLQAKVSRRRRFHSEVEPCSLSTRIKTPTAPGRFWRGIRRSWGWLREISPSAAMEDVRARLYVAHDHADAYLPFSGSLQLANAAKEHTTVVFRSFVLFAHLYPTNDANRLIFLREVWNLYWHVVAVLAEVA